MSTTAAILMCVGIVGVLTATITALRSVSRIWLRRWVERRLRGGVATEPLLERPHRILLSGVALSSAVVIMTGSALSRFAEQSLTAFAVAAGATLLLLALFGHLIPRAIARRWPARIIPILLPPLRALDAVIGPLLAAAQRAVLRGGEPGSVTAPAQPRDALHELLEEGVMEGVGEPEEIAIITGVVEFAEKTVRDVMTPRAAIFAVDGTLPAGELARRIAASGYSRVPVFSGTLDSMVGMVHAFDLLKPGADVSLPIRPITSTEATRPCNELLAEMMRRRRHLTIVTEPGRGTVGLVTLEDLLEELVGDIRDEHDEPDVAAPAAQA